MKIESTRFGTIEITEEDILRFPLGIPGFLNEKEFVLLPHGTDSPFSFLQSVKEPNLSFLLVDPFAFYKDYEFVLDETLAKEMELTEDNPPRVWVIATIKENIRDMTVNLLAPIILNTKKREGRQIILEQSPYSIRHKLFTESVGANAGERGE